MSYSNSPYTARPLVFAGTVLGTATASGTNAATGTDLKVAPVAFVRKSVITAIQVIADVATPANWTALKLIVKNGTNVVGTQTGLGTFTSAQLGAPAVTAANATFTAGAAPTFTLDGTGTASGQVFGTFNVYFEVQEIPV